MLHQDPRNGGLVGLRSAKRTIDSMKISQLKVAGRADAKVLIESLTQSPFRYVGYGRPEALGRPAFDVGGKLDFAAITERRRRWHEEGCPPWFRRRVVELVEGGRRVAEVAVELQISEQTIYTWGRRHCSMRPPPRGNVVPYGWSPRRNAR